MVDTIFTRGEMERNLSQSVQAFYRNQLGCKPEKVSCHIINEQVAIAVKNPITPIERLFSNPDDRHFVRGLRDRIDSRIKNELHSLIEGIVEVEVIAITIDTTLDNDLTGVVALLAQRPKLREVKRSTKKSKVKV